MRSAALGFARAAAVAAAVALAGCGTPPQAAGDGAATTLPQQAQSPATQQAAAARALAASPLQTSPAPASTEPPGDNSPAVPSSKPAVDPPSQPSSTLPPSEGSLKQQPDSQAPAYAGKPPQTKATASSAPADMPAQPATASQAPASAAPAATGSAPSAADPAPPAATPQAAESKQPTAQLSIVGDKKHGVILSATSVAFEDGDTVFDLLQKTAKQHKIQMEYRGKGATIYIEGIDNLYEFDEGPKSGWVYKVNGKIMTRGAGSSKLAAGDKIEWLYTLDLGKDVEGTAK
jgi:hypothetical protein